MRRSAILAIALGGAVGAATRWAVLEPASPDGGFPAAVFALNVLGSFVLGGVLAVERRRPEQSVLLRDGLGIGLCGGLTTFSTFAVEVATLTRDGDPVTAIVYVVASVVAAIAAVVLGAALMGAAGASGDPLEAEA